MTVAPVLTCGVCATSLSGQEERCPSCGAPTATAQPAAPGPLPTLLAGCARANGGARALAVVVDVLVAGALAAGTLLSPALGWGALAVLVLGTVLALALTGRTLGGLVAGVRTVDLFSGTPLYGRVLTGWRGDALTLDVRKARDPLRSAGTAVPRPAAPRATAPAAPAAAAGGAWPSAPRTTATPQPFAPGPAAPAPGPAAPAPRPAPSPAVSAPSQAAPAPSPAVSAPSPAARAPSPAPVPHPQARQQQARQQAAPAPVEATVRHVAAPGAATPTAHSGRIAVVTPDGAHIAVAERALLGRNPRPRPEEEGATLVPLADLERTVSKTHAALRWDGRTVWLTDRGSTNGTVVTDTTGVTRRLEAHVEVPVELGSTVHLGDLAVTITGEGVTR